MSGEGKALDHPSESLQHLLLDQAQRLEAGGKVLSAANLIAAALPKEGLEIPNSHLTLARRAVSLYSRAGEVQTAAHLMVRLPVDLALFAADETEPAAALAAAALAESGGRTELAFRLRSWLGHYSEAARLARRLDRHHDAGELFLRAAMPFEASRSFAQAGDGYRAIGSLLGVDTADPLYRLACVSAIRLASEEGELPFALDHFVSSFVGNSPHDPTELDALTLLANLYLGKGLKESASRVAEVLLAANPAHPLARQIRAHLSSASLPLDERTLLPDLPEAPTLPDPEDILPTARRRPIAGVFSVGTLVEGRYRLVERIGRGGTSAIFKALDTILGDHIALKAFLQAVPDENMDRRIRRELRMAREISHPNIVRVHELGSEQGFRYITMELLVGTDLRAKMNQGLPIARCLDYLIQICDGLGAAHEKGIVHRDIKPENCFIVAPEVVKLLDFGIAKVVSAPGATQSGAILGTPDYISPEQINDYSGVTHRADLYSLGIVAYEMLAQRPPFGPADLMALLHMHLDMVPLPPRKHQPSIPPALECAIMRLLEKDPARRHESCAELKGELIAIRPTLI